jgi:hypothetical protein
MRRAPKRIAFAILAAIWAVGAAGCVSIPIPPQDMGKVQRGELGTLNVRVVAEYKPNWAGTVQAGLRQWANKSTGKEVIKLTR